MKFWFNLSIIIKTEYRHKGNLFTLFLTSPLFAFCFVCNINNVPSTQLFNKAQLFIEQIFSEIGKSINKSKQIDFIYSQFYSDEFLRAFILRFVFCYATLRLHRGFKVCIFDYTVARY